MLSNVYHLLRNMTNDGFFDTLFLLEPNETSPPKRVLIMRNELYYSKNYGQEASQIWNLYSKSEYSQKSLMNAKHLDVAEENVLFHCSFAPRSSCSIIDWKP